MGDSIEGSQKLWFLKKLHQTFVNAAFDSAHVGIRHIYL